MTNSYMSAPIYLYILIHSSIYKINCSMLCILKYTVFILNLNLNISLVISKLKIVFAKLRQSRVNVCHLHYNF